MEVSAGLSCYSSWHPRTRSRRTGNPPSSFHLRLFLHQNHSLRLRLCAHFSRQQRSTRKPARQLDVLTDSY